MFFVLSGFVYDSKSSIQTYLNIYFKIEKELKFVYEIINTRNENKNETIQEFVFKFNKSFTNLINPNAEDTLIFDLSYCNFLYSDFEIYKI